MYKNLLRILFLSSVISLTGCSTEELFTMAIDYERGRADLELKSVKLDFGEITYLENKIKNDTAIVLLHGFGGDKDNWNRFSAELDETNRIVVLDLPGHGESISDKKLGYSITHQARMLDKFLQAIKINKAHLIGNSMGGAIALKYSDSYAKKVTSLILIDALGMIKTKSEFTQTLEKTGDNPFFNVCTEEKLDKLLHIGMQKPPYIPGILMEYLVSKKCAKSDIEKIVYNDMLKDSDLSHIAMKIQVPTLIIWGQKDRVLHVDNARLFHSTIKGSQLVIFDELGHVPLLEDAGKTAQATETFINNI